jgi:hypothetical protein
MKAQQAAEVLHAVRSAQGRRGVDTRPLIIINIPRPPGETPVHSPRNPSRVVCAQDLAADDPLRLELEAEGHWLAPFRAHAPVNAPYLAADDPLRLELEALGLLAPPDEATRKAIKKAMKSDEGE